MVRLDLVSHAVADGQRLEQASHLSLCVYPCLSVCLSVVSLSMASPWSSPEDSASASSQHGGLRAIGLLTLKVKSSRASI